MQRISQYGIKGPKPPILIIKAPTLGTVRVHNGKESPRHNDAFPGSPPLIGTNEFWV